MKKRAFPQNKREKIVLQWINEVRKAINRSAVRSFKQGAINSQRPNCTLARTIGGNVEIGSYSTRVYQEVFDSFDRPLGRLLELEVPHPPAIAAFIRSLDEGKYPWLQEVVKVAK